MKYLMAATFFLGLCMSIYAQKKDLEIKGTKRIINETTPRQSIDLHANLVQLKGPKKMVKKATPEQIIYLIAKSIQFNEEAYKGKNIAMQPLIDSLARYVQFYNPSVSEALKQWTAFQEYNINASVVVDYTVSYRKHHMYYYGLYKADGSIVESRIEQDPVDLPKDIQKSVKKSLKNFRGYKISSKIRGYYKNFELDKSTEYYEIIAKNGNEKKIFNYSPDGALVKVSD